MSSPQKRKLSDVADEPITSRSGRIRKPKVFYDPSYSDAKRRSMPNMETAKGKKVTKAQAVEVEPEDIKVEKIKIDIQEKEKPKTTTASAAAAAINNRRRTVCAASFFDDENGCIVCGRNDVKKGRFVNCTDCSKRGHFTCLRNNKLYKTADEEHKWQCTACKICDYCRKVKPNEQLYKCIICLNSYHLHCSSKHSPLPKTIVKKKFTCGVCMKGLKPTDPAKSIIPNRKSDGFPGFTHEDSSKIESKAAPKLKKVILMPPATKPVVSEHTEIEEDFDVKVEKISPTPEQQPTRSESNESLANVEANKISVRKDLVQETKAEVDDMKAESDDDKMDIAYDTKTVITPHDSVPDVRKWDCDEVFTYFMGKTTPEYAHLLKENQIDGDALLLIKREDVLNRFNLKLGPALRLYAQIVALQYKNNNPILAWNEF